VLLLIRHGQTAWSKSGQHTSRTDLPLLPEGEEQAARLKAVLATRGTPALVLCSPRQRARVTAALAGLNIDETVEDLAEWDYGQYEGLTTPEIRVTAPGWTIWQGPTPGGETVAQITLRTDRVIERVSAVLEAQDDGAGDVVVVGHGHALRVLVARWLGLRAVDGALFVVEAGTFGLLGYERETRTLLGLNRGQD
jgi:broad specificity phosphatase PhoE